MFISYTIFEKDRKIPTHKSIFHNFEITFRILGLVIFDYVYWI